MEKLDTEYNTFEAADKLVAEGYFTSMFQAYDAIHAGIRRGALQSRRDTSKGRMPHYIDKDALLVWAKANPRKQRGRVWNVKRQEFEEKPRTDTSAAP